MTTITTSELENFNRAIANAEHALDNGHIETAKGALMGLTEIPEGSTEHLYLAGYVAAKSLPLAAALPDMTLREHHLSEFLFESGLHSDIAHVLSGFMHALLHETEDRNRPVFDPK